MRKKSKTRSPSVEKILSVKISTLSKQKIINLISHRTEQKSSTVIFTPNTQILLDAQSSPRNLLLLNSADINIPDGIGVLLASKILGGIIKKRISGIELGEALLALAEKKGYRVFLLGAKKGVAKKAKKALKKHYPKLKICGTHHGYFSEEQSFLVCQKIRCASPHILFVCLGSPRQELWIDNHRRQLPTVRVFMGLGGALDVWSGRLCRAPRGLRRLGLEWAWRMLLEPRRLGGLLPISAFLLAAVRERLRVKTSVPNLKKT